MKQKASTCMISGILGVCGQQQVFLGYASASFLCEYSFAEILDENTGLGYQRPINKQHSRDFYKYITQPDSSTVPLVFNLRSELSNHWEIVNSDNGLATLHLKHGIKSLAQVDCQHRLGALNECELNFAFMTFIGLDLRSEMAMFYVINSKAKGLSSSLTDYHESNLVDDIRRDAPHLFIARRLNEDPYSPWFQMIRYGGERTSGVKRRASLRMLQKSVMRFLRILDEKDGSDIERLYQVICAYWRAIQRLFGKEWSDHRHHLLTKGLGLYSLMTLLGELAKDRELETLSENWFYDQLKPMKGKVDWRTNGEFAEAGGQKGVQLVFERLKRLVVK